MLPGAILVSLCEQPGSGYELARRFDRSISYFWAATHQQIYRTLKSMEHDGLHISFGPDRSDPRLLEVDNVVICAGQESVRDLEDGLRGHGITPHVIGGAALAAELDAKRAIRQSTELAAKL
jgi:2,4-dienoyl-CoA reductase (NADPH2)